jgi:hypothetical protein
MTKKSNKNQLKVTFPDEKELHPEVVRILNTQRSNREMAGVGRRAEALYTAFGEQYIHALEGNSFAAYLSLRETLEDGHGQSPWHGIHRRSYKAAKRTYQLQNPRPDFHEEHSSWLSHNPQASD